MPFAIGGNSRIRTNIAAENAYNSLETSNRMISLRQLRLSTGKRINSAADDVAGYITARALQARNGAMKSALRTVGDASNVTNIIMDSLDNIYEQLNKISEATSYAASGAQGTAERIALAKAAWRLAQQIQTVVDSTVFGGRQLLDGTFSANFVIGTNASHNLLSINIDMRSNSGAFDLESSMGFDLNAEIASSFAGVTGLNLSCLDEISETNIESSIYGINSLSTTLGSLSAAIFNVNRVASYVGGITNRLASQEDLLKSQITNYNTAISRIEDADVAMEQLELIKAQFLQQTSLVSLAQANQNPQSFLRLIQQ
jgi:flagellin